MISRKTGLVSALSFMMFVFLSVSVSAQTYAEVVEAFNAAAEDIKSGNFELAISKFENCIELATQLGPEGDEMKANAESQIPVIYLRLAKDVYKAKDYEEAIKKFEETIMACEKYTNEKIKKDSEKYLLSSHYNVANQKYKGDDFEGALSHFNSAIEYNSEYAKAYYGKGLVYQKQGDLENMLVAFEKAIEFGNSTGDEKIASASSNKVRDYYFRLGTDAVKADDYQTAVNNLSKALKYDLEHSQSYYWLAVMYNKEMEYDKAVANAVEALKFDKTEDHIKARIYYELGNAYVGLVEYEKACDAFRNALYDPYTNTVKYKMENVLNCGSE